MSLQYRSFRQTTIRKHRAIANIVTSGILLSAVSIMGVMMLGWSQTNIATQQQEMNEVFDIQMNKINEDLIFENIWFATPAGNMIDNHLNVTVANIGILGFNITSIQVTNTTGTNNTAFGYTYTNAGVVTGNSISLNTTYPWESADELNVRIFTDRGNQFLSQVVAP